jgi:UDP-glucose 4-epimerase
MMGATVSGIMGGCTLQAAAFGYQRTVVTGQTAQRYAGGDFGPLITPERKSEARILTAVEVSGRVAFPPSGLPSTLVIGSGFLGSHIIRNLLDQGNPVRALTRRTPAGPSEDLTRGAEFLIGDAGVTATVDEALEDMDHVVFALSSLMPGEAEQEPQLDLSLILQPLLELLAQLGQTPDRRLTFLSSGGTVYGRTDVFPTPEDAPTAPLSAYGITRLTAERFVLRYGALHAVPVRILRVANAYGPGQTGVRGQGIIGTTLEHCLTGEPVTVFGDGRISRDFVHVQEIGHATASLVNLNGGPEVVNIGSGTDASLSEVHRLTQEVTGRPLAIRREPGRDFDVPRVQLDISVLQSLVDFWPRDLSDGIASTWRDLLSRQGKGGHAASAFPNVS